MLAFKVCQGPASLNGIDHGATLAESGIHRYLALPVLTLSPFQRALAPSNATSHTRRDLVKMSDTSGSDVMSVFTIGARFIERARRLLV